MASDPTRPVGVLKVKLLEQCSNIILRSRKMFFVYVKVEGIPNQKNKEIAAFEQGHPGAIRP